MKETSGCRFRGPKPDTLPFAGSVWAAIFPVSRKEPEKAMYEPGFRSARTEGSFPAKEFPVFPSGPTRRLSPKAFPALFLPLLLPFLLLACPEPEDPSGPWTASPEWIKANLHGTWSFTGEYGTDRWIIAAADLNSQKLSYDMDADIFFEGIIREVRIFGGNSGVIFIKYTKKPTDYGAANPVEGDYVGIFFRSLSAASGQFAQPVNGDYTTPAQPTLDAALDAFTADTMADYVSEWSTYVRQP